MLVESSAKDLEDLPWIDVLKMTKCVVRLPLHGISQDYEFMNELKKSGFEFDCDAYCDATPALNQIIRGNFSSNANMGKNEGYDLFSPFRHVIQCFDPSLKVGFDVPDNSTREYKYRRNADLVVIKGPYTIIRMVFAESSPELFNLIGDILPCNSERWRCHTHGPIKNMLGIAIAKRAYGIVSQYIMSDNGHFHGDWISSDNDRRNPPSLEKVGDRLQLLRTLLNVVAYFSTKRWENAPRETSLEYDSLRYWECKDGKENYVYYDPTFPDQVFKLYGRRGSEWRIENNLIPFYAATKKIQGLEKLVQKSSYKEYLSDDPLVLSHEPRCFNISCSIENYATAILQVAKTLRAIHQAGWIHGDVTWRNIKPLIGVQTTEWILIDCEFAIRRIFNPLSADTGPFTFSELFCYHLSDFEDLFLHNHVKGHMVTNKNIDIDLALIDMRMLGDLARYTSSRLSEEHLMIMEKARKLRSAETPQALYEAFDSLFCDHEITT